MTTPSDELVAALADYEFHWYVEKDDIMRANIYHKDYPQHVFAFHVSKTLTQFDLLRQQVDNHLERKLNGQA